MEGFPQLDTGKRKRSPAVNLVNVPIPFPCDGPTQLQDGLLVSPGDSLPLPKRPRLPEKPPLPADVSGSPCLLVSLPPGILQAVFSYLDPPSLGRLIRVNRLCRDLLDSRRPLPSDTTVVCSQNARCDGEAHYGPRCQDVVWQTSRKAHAPGMPQPIQGMAECEQFALSFGITCQFCGALPIPVSAYQGTSPSLPIEYSVRVLWPFRTRSCIQCLAPRLRKVSHGSACRLIPILTSLLGL